MRVLAVGAHPDDLEILCAGTLAKYSAQGAKVFMAHLCNGNMGGRNIDPDKLAKIRAKEAKSAAKVIGAEPLGPIAGDLDLYSTREMRVEVIDIIRYAKPEVILTHNKNDYMPDHVITSELVFDASFTATLPNYKTKHKVYEPIVPIYYFDTPACVGFEPTDYVDITKYFNVKKKMLAYHKSQLTWIKGHHTSDAVELLETMAKLRGLQCGVKYAEAFHKAQLWGKIKPKNYLP